MRILAFSDLHRNQDVAHRIVAHSGGADVVVGAGDFATLGEGALDTLEILRSCAAPLILVHGNHDCPDEIRGFCDQIQDWHYLHGTSVSIQNNVFFGIGGEIPSRNSFAWNAAETEATASVLLSRCPPKSVLVTHTPPLGTADIQADNSHEGSAAIESGIKLFAPKLHLCGHIHHAWGMRGTVGETPVYNLGPIVNWFEI